MTARTAAATSFDTSRSRAEQLDAIEPLPTLRHRFRCRRHRCRYPEVAYLAGNSLGLQPVTTRPPG